MKLCAVSFKLQLCFAIQLCIDDTVVTLSTIVFRIFIFLTSKSAITAMKLATTAARTFAILAVIVANLLQAHLNIVF
jgi:hypothetical protein